MSRLGPLPHEDLNKAWRRIKLAAVRSKRDWLEPMGATETKRLRRAIRL